jgi:divalent metal cation (Fe/Co/Zn/Cd) transporter
MLLLGLGFPAWAGWWWADPVAAFLMLPILAREGWDAIEVSKGNTGYRTEKTGPERNI